MKTKSVIPILLATMLMLAACGTKANVTPAGTLPPISGGCGNVTQVAIQGFAFNPADITIKVGDTVTWTNMDTVVHTVVADDGSWGSGQLSKGDQFSFTFTQAGTYTYKCGVHPNMIGKIIVSP